MQTTLPATPASRNLHQIRFAAFFSAALISMALLIAFGALASANLAANSASAANASATRAAASSARLSALDQQLFAVVDADQNTAARNQRLLDLNAQYYPSEANPATIAAQHNTRLLELNNRFYPATPDAYAGIRNSANLR